MPLFGSNRDAGFLRGVNLEVIHKIISNEVVLYKIDKESTKTNIYGESDRRHYKTGIRIFAHILNEPKESTVLDDAINIIKTITVSFIKSDLKNQDVYVEIGDIIYHDNEYYEIDNTLDQKNWTSRNPNTNIGMTKDSWPLHGYDHSIFITAHLTDSEILNMDEGIRSTHQSNTYDIPSFNVDLTDDEDIYGRE